MLKEKKKKIGQKRTMTRYDWRRPSVPRTEGINQGQSHILRKIIILGECEASANTYNSISISKQY